MKITFIQFILLFCTFVSSAQYFSPFAGNDTNKSCTTDCVQLKNRYSASGLYKSTDSYSVERKQAFLYQTNYNFDIESNNTINLGSSSNNDLYFNYNNGTQLPFNFCFYNDTFNKIWISPNGYIKFAHFAPDSLSANISTSLPSTTSGGVNISNCVFAHHLDLHTNYQNGGNVNIATYGVAPFRAFVISWDSVRLHNPTIDDSLCLISTLYEHLSNRNCFQIVLYETSNIIEVQTYFKTACQDIGSGNNSVQGIQNANGTIFNSLVDTLIITLPVFNNNLKLITRFTPNGAYSGTNIWLDSSLNILTTSNNKDTITVCSALPSTYYLSKFTFNLCGSIINYIDTVRVGIDNIHLSILPISPICNYDSLSAKLAINVFGGHGQYTASWAPNVVGATLIGGGNIVNIDTIINLLCTNASPSCYTVTVTDASGCTKTSTACLSLPSPITIPTIFNPPIGNPIASTITLGTNTVQLPADTIGIIVVPFGSNGGPWSYDLPSAGLNFPCIIPPNPPTSSNIYKITCKSIPYNLPDCYPIRISDYKGCFKDTSRCIVGTSPINIVIDSIVGLNCNYTSCGKLQVRRIGGTLGYSAPFTAMLYPTIGSPIAPSTTTGPTANPIWRWNCLQAGTYTILVRDNKKYWDTAIITITDTLPEPFVSYPLWNLYTGDNFGGGAYPSPFDIPNLTYTWQGPGLNIVNSTQYQIIIPDINSNMNSNIYTLTVTDAIGCSNSTTFSIYVIPRNVVNAKVFLSGTYNASTQLMNDNLRTLNLIPLEDPYDQPPYNTSLNIPLNSIYGETYSSILATTGNNAIVDWVYIELRHKNNIDSVVAFKSALLQRDGNIVNSLNGTGTVPFQFIYIDSYYVCVRHRNHFGVMTKYPVPIDEFSPLLDFTNTSTQLYRRPAPFNNNFIYTSTQDSCTRILGTPAVRALYAGNSNISSVGSPSPYKIIKYVGINNDRLPILSLAGTSGSIFGYLSEDLNLNGSVNYNGLNNDRILLLQNIGFNLGQTIYQQLRD